MLRQLITISGNTALAFSALILPLSAIYGVDAWPCEIINSLRPQIGVGLLFLAAVMLLARRILTSCLLLAVALGAYFSAIPIDGARRIAPQETGLTVVWANVWRKPSALDQTIALAKAHDADVIALTEFPWSMLEQTSAGLRAQYPYVAQSDDAGLGGIVVFSKMAISDEVIFGGERRSGLAMTLDLDGAPLRFVAIHPPIPATDEMTKSRNEIVETGFQILGNAERGLYVGDFNTTPWSAALTRPAKAASAEFLGRNGKSTWRSKLPALGLPLDHAFYRGPEAAAMEVGPAIGSDHYPLIVTIGPVVNPAPQP